MKKSVPAAHFDSPQLKSMMNVACAGTEVRTNPPARANGVKSSERFFMAPLLLTTPLKWRFSPTVSGQHNYTALSMQPLQ
jgi:hypothetical protein